MKPKTNDNQGAIKDLFQKYERDLSLPFKSLERSVSDTAYLVCESRARRVDISQDIYARQWIAPDSRKAITKLWDEFSKKVYPYDDLEVSLRNRYWLEQIRKFALETDNPAFINIGAGLTSYPFLLKNTVPSIEVDKPTIVGCKYSKMKVLQQQQFLPLRDISYYPVDLDSEEDLKLLNRILHQQFASHSSFILCEGLMYYLQRPTVNAMIDMFRSFQQEESILGLDFWRPSVANSPVFLKMNDFFSERFGLEKDQYTFIDDKWFYKINGYKVVNMTDVVTQEAVFADSTDLQDSTNRLLETYAVLKRT